jgi:hypothetical protein
MSSPRCTLNRWGSGGGNGGRSEGRSEGRSGGKTGGETPKTAEAKEMEDRLKKMMAERNKVDNMWSLPTPNNSTRTDK